MSTVDVHNHFYPPEYFDALKKYGAIRDTLISWKSNEGLSKADVVLLEDTLRFVAGRLRTASAVEE